MIHGGILAALVDEVMGYVLFSRGMVGVTARMEVRYRASVRQGDLLVVRARPIHESRRLLDVEAQIMRGHQIVTEATARFMKVGPLFDENGDAVIRTGQEDML